MQQEKEEDQKQSKVQKLIDKNGIKFIKIGANKINLTFDLTKFLKNLSMSPRLKCIRQSLQSNKSTSGNSLVVISKRKNSKSLYFSLLFFIKVLLIQKLIISSLM